MVSNRRKTSLKFQVTLLEELSGEKASIYSVVLGDDSISLFEKFLVEFEDTLDTELMNILARLRAIGHATGARENYFKLNEGELGDGVCALYDSPSKKLRLYCIRYGTQIVILGGGSLKPKHIRAWQENERLKVEANRMIEISKRITEAINDPYSTIKFSLDGLTLQGDLNFESDENE